MINGKPLRSTALEEGCVCGSETRETEPRHRLSVLSPYYIYLVKSGAQGPKG